MNAEIFLYKPWRPKSYFQLEIIIFFLVRSFRFILVHVMSLRPLYMCISFSVWTVFSVVISRQKVNRV